MSLLEALYRLAILGLLACIAAAVTMRPDAKMLPSPLENLSVVLFILGLGALLVMVAK